MGLSTCFEMLSKMSIQNIFAIVDPLFSLTRIERSYRDSLFKLQTKFKCFLSYPVHFLKFKIQIQKFKIRTEHLSSACPL